MSDILIKNMEMPKRGMVVNIHADGRVTNYFDEFGKTIGKAVPVPPHGRCINADALDILCKREQQAWQDYEHNPDNEYLEGVKDGLHEALKQLSTAMIIIEAKVK